MGRRKSRQAETGNNGPLSDRHNKNTAESLHKNEASEVGKKERKSKKNKKNKKSKKSKKELNKEGSVNDSKRGNAAEKEVSTGDSDSDDTDLPPVTSLSRNKLHKPRPRVAHTADDIQPTIQITQRSARKDEDKRKGKKREQATKPQSPVISRNPSYFHEVIPCDYGAYGCNYWGPRFEQLVHLASAETALAHMRLLEAALKAAENTFARLKWGDERSGQRYTEPQHSNIATNVVDKQPTPSRIKRRYIITSDSDEKSESSEDVTCHHCGDEGGDMYKCRKCKNWYHEACDYERHLSSAQQISTGRCAQCVKKADAKSKGSDEDSLLQRRRKRPRPTVDELGSSDSDGSLDEDEWEEGENTDDREFIDDASIDDAYSDESDY